MSNLPHLCRRQCGTDDEGAGDNANEGEEEKKGVERMPTITTYSVPTMARSLCVSLLSEFFLKSSRPLQNLVMRGLGKPKGLLTENCFDIWFLQMTLDKRFWYVEIDLLRDLLSSFSDLLELDSGRSRYQKLGIAMIGLTILFVGDDG
ncbi:hypothetical protein STEG23_009245 [Scotinomys teguina]